LIKTAIEHGFRYYILINFKKLSINDFKYLLDLSVSAAERKLCSPPTPIFLMNDILNNLTIEDCSDIFSYLEDTAQLWRSDLFYASVKNYLLRMCNGKLLSGWCNSNFLTF
jgi:THO complex subunit 1